MSSVLSIITVVYNSPEQLQKTILSIKNQSYKDLEHIIIDGGSSDSTIEVIKNNQEFITNWISEPDKGIYHAMNKGLKMATGDYVWFINAGDEIFDSDTLSRIMECNKDADVLYGETMIIDKNGNEIGLRRLKPTKPLTWKSFRMGQLVSHQSFIAKREICPLFDLRYSHSADTDWQIKILKKAKVVVNTNMILCRFLDGGKSKQNIIPSLKERFEIMVKNYGFLRTIINHIVIGVKFFGFVIKHRRF